MFINIALVNFEECVKSFFDGWRTFQFIHF